MKDHVAVSGVCRDLAQKIKEFGERSKKFNNQEQLFEKELTDYSKLTHLKKDFDPYFNLWTTSNMVETFLEFNCFMSIFFFFSGSKILKFGAMDLGIN